MINDAIVDAPKSPESYDDFGFSSAKTAGIEKEANASLLSEILEDFQKESEGDGSVKKEAQSAKEDKVNEEKPKGKEEKAEVKEEEEEKDEKEERKAEDMAIENELSKDAAGYYDLGTWMAIEKVAEFMVGNEILDEKTAAAISLHTASLTDSLVKNA